MGRVILQGSTLPDNCCSPTTNEVAAKYDLAGDLIQLAYPDGRVMKQSWDGSGHLNPSGSNQYAVWFDNYNGTTVNYPYLSSASYFPNGTPQTMTLGNGVVQTYSANNRQQLTEITLQATGSGLNQKLFDKFYCYGPGTTSCPVFGPGKNNGNIWAIGDNLNGANSLNTSYDTINRITHFTNGSGSMAQTYTYDPYGNMSQVSPGTLQSNLSFNANNRIIDSGFLYDASGNLTQANFGIGAQSYAYDSESQLVNFGNGAETYTYDAEGNRIEKSNGTNWTEYVYFNGQPLAEKNSNGSWSDYIYANGQRIARADTYDARIYTSGTTPGGALASWQIASGNNYVIQSGDILCWRQYQANGIGGPNIQFVGGSQTYGNLDDNAGQPVSALTTEGQWVYRTANLKGFIGQTVNDYQVLTDVTSPAGSYGIYYGDIAIVSTNGTVTSIYDGQQGGTFSVAYNSGNGGQTNLSAVEQSSDLTGDAEQPMNVTAYYHGDHLGSARLVTAAGGWPISSDTFYPFGQEQALPPDPNHYKFTGKERDTESGNDYFGARYYASSMGRFMSPDPSQLYYADPKNPQSLNLYAYVLNNPLIYNDPTGMDCTYTNADGSQTILRGDCLSDDDDGVYTDCDGCLLNKPITADLSPGVQMQAVAPEKGNVFTCASEFASKYSIAGGLQALGIGTSGVGGFITNALGGNVFSGATDLVSSFATGSGGGHGIAYNMGQGLVAGPTQGFGAPFSNSTEGTPFAAGPADLATGAILSGVNSAINAGGSLTTLAGEVSTAGLTGAEYATGVGEIKLGVDAGIYALGLAKCAAGK